MKWPFTSIVVVFACISFASSLPYMPNDVAMMYPSYPYMQYDYVNFDIGRLFRKAANSVKNFYAYVNNWIFGKNDLDRERLYQYWKQRNAGAPSNDAGLNIQNARRGGIHVEAYKIYKDSNGNTVVKNLQNSEISNLSESGIKSFIDGNIIKEIQRSNHQSNNEKVSAPKGENNGIANNNAHNPFQWNEKLAKDKLFASPNKIVVQPIAVLQVDVMDPSHKLAGIQVKVRNNGNVLHPEVHNNQPNVPKNEQKQAAANQPNPNADGNQPQVKESPTEQTQEKESPTEQPQQKESPTEQHQQKESPSEQPQQKESPTEQPQQKESPTEQRQQKESPSEQPQQKESPAQQPQNENAKEQPQQSTKKSADSVSLYEEERRAAEEGQDDDDDDEAEPEQNVKQPEPKEPENTQNQREPSNNEQPIQQNEPAQENQKPNDEPKATNNNGAPLGQENNVNVQKTNQENADDSLDTERKVLEMVHNLAQNQKNSDNVFFDWV